MIARSKGLRRQCVRSGKEACQQRQGKEIDDQKRQLVSTQVDRPKIAPNVGGGQEWGRGKAKLNQQCRNGKPQQGRGFGWDFSRSFIHKPFSISTKEPILAGR
jgi:hypothetical protein